MKDNFFPTHHAHNLVLNVALGTGYIGAILLVCQLGVLVRRFFGGHNPFSSLLIVAVLLEGFAEGQMFGPTPTRIRSCCYWRCLLRQDGHNGRRGGGVIAGGRMSLELMAPGEAGLGARIGRRRPTSSS